MDEDKFDCDNFIEIPHKNDLDLGQRLVFELQRSECQANLTAFSKSSAIAAPTEGSRTFWNIGDSCRAGMISRTKEKKRHCADGVWKMELNALSQIHHKSYV